MAIDFPTSPALNEVYTYNDRSWKWNGTAWDAVKYTFTVGMTPGGTAGQVLSKTSSNDYDTEWANLVGAVYQNDAPSTPSVGQVWVDANATAGVLNQNDYLLTADAAALYLTQVNAALTYSPIANGIRVYASTAARTSAIPSPTEGMVTYITATKSVEVYNGTAWVAIGGSGGFDDFLLMGA